MPGTYLQTSTQNPYGHRPWQTSLYQGFEEFAWLKQPQNLILREDLTMRPEIYKPPEMKLGDATLVSGSGRVIRRGRRRLGGLGAIMSPYLMNGRPFPIYRPPVYTAFPRPVATGSSPNVPVITPTIYPPSLMPVNPTIVASGPGGTVYSVQGSTPPAGSPFMPAVADPYPPGSTPTSAAAGAAAASTPATSALSDWFNAQTWIPGIPNGYLAVGIAGAFFVLATKKK